MTRSPRDLIGFKPAYEGQSLADFLANRDSPKNSTVQGNDFQGRIRRFDDEAAIAENHRAGLAAVNMASAARESRIAPMRREMPGFAGGAEFQEPPRSFGNEPAMSGNQLAGQSAVNMASAARESRIAPMRREMPGFASGEAMPRAAFMQPRPGERIPRDVMEAAMTGKDPSRLADWAGSTQGQKAGGLSALMEQVDPALKARRQALDMQQAQQQQESAKERKVLGAYLSAVNPDKYNKDTLAGASLADLAAARQFETTNQAVQMQTEQQRLAAEAAEKEQNFSNVMTGLDAFKRGVPFSEIDFGGRQMTEDQAKGMLDMPAYQNVLEMSQAGLDVGTGDLRQFMEAGFKDRKPTPGPIEEQALPMSGGAVLVQDGRALWQVAAPKSADERLTPFEETLNRGIDDGLFSQEEAAAIRKDYIRRQAQGSGNTLNDLFMAALGGNLPKGGEASSNNAEEKPSREYSPVQEQGINKYIDATGKTREEAIKALKAAGRI